MAVVFRKGNLPGKLCLFGAILGSLEVTESLQPVCIIIRLQQKDSLATMATYHISHTEIRRRLWAYISLVVFWIGTQSLLMWLWPPSNQEIGWLFLAVEAGALMLLGGVTFYFFFTRYIKSSVELDDKHLTRFTVKGRYKISLAEVRGITVKRTTRQLIRQVSVRTASGQRCNYDGLVDFDHFVTNLRKSCPHARYASWNERLDYDSLLFYPLLGAVMAFLISAFMQAATSSASFLDSFYLIFLFYIAAMSGFFAITKPLAKQYGKKSALVDCILALIFGFSALVMLWIQAL